ncbi:DUF4856 domain-containing protein [Pontibacter sp. JAM-7]|uniref:DUF4856 domain-containing protein n=1 Tax=Pontibacter sp. JAM-7 TaxID=3366581 RepID=UPI003AF5F8B2
MSIASNQVGAADNYADFPITLKGYSGDATDSVAYQGQVARQVLHTSLKKLARSSDGDNAKPLSQLMQNYYAGGKAGLDIIDPTSREGFPLHEQTVDDLSKNKNLSDKAYKGLVTGWPGNLTGDEVLQQLLKNAAQTPEGYDRLNGYDYSQLVSKFTMGAVFYHQAVANYLDKKLAADVKPNDKAYKKGVAYTGKEHIWDEAFGYFGAPAHTLNLTAEQVYAIGKQKPAAFAVADANGDGKVSLYNEMAFGHAVYAAGSDRSGKSQYLHTITQAFVDGRKLITAANGQALTAEQRNQLQGYARVIASNWEKVIAEAVFKYAGEVYEDLEKLDLVIETNGDAGKLFRNYVKHWGELKGFALALQTSGKDLGATSVQLNRLIGYGPVLLGNTQVTGVNANGDFIQSESVTLKEYMHSMLKVQKLLLDEFALTARQGDVLSDMSELADKLGSGKSAEND